MACRGVLFALTELQDEDFEYTWHYVQAVRDFYKRAAAAGRSVMFTVDQ